MPVTYTEIDRKCFELIKSCGGFVTIVNGEPHLESNTQISNYRFDRLVAHGKLKSSDDALIEGLPPQTYTITGD